MLTHDTIDTLRQAIEESTARAWRRYLAARERQALERVRRATARDLRALGYDALRDIGIEPSDIPQVARDMSRRAVTDGRRNDPAPTPATDARCCA